MSDGEPHHEDPWPPEQSWETPEEIDDPWPADDDHGNEYADGVDERRPMTWQGLAPGQRWSWFDWLWSEVCVLGERYRLSVRSEWWADQLQVEVLAAFATWVQRYDSGEWDDPPGKLALLFDLERVAAALRDGVEPFNPERDRPIFERHLRMLGCRPPPR